MNPFRAIINIILPKNCLVCSTSGYIMCPECLRKVSPPWDQLHPWMVSVFRYKNPHIKQSLWKLKYQGAHSIADDLAPYMYDELMDMLGDTLSIEKEKLVLIPIPMTRRKLRERGFNQSDVLAQAVKNQNRELFSVSYKSLEKIKETVPQAKIKVRSKRLANMRGVFIVKNPANIKNKTIILVDDITTTGATISEAKKVLKKAGAKQVFAVTVGH